MAMVVIRSEDRGRTQIDWLDSRHTFSFGEYYDPKRMGFGPLRVINEDRVAAGGGFPSHAHRDMEIISYVIEGGLQHKDSMGHGSVIRPGDVQHMSAGTGVRHSEFNASDAEPVHFLQIWVLPERDGAAPGYDQKTFPAAEKAGRLRLVASGDGRDGSIAINRDVDLYATILEPGEAVEHRIAQGRATWIQVVRGSVTANGESLGAGDGAGTVSREDIRIEAVEKTEVLLFDMRVSV
ncbi:Pirin domain protein [Rhodomicrobium vannielii ATCC 17100]|uniref:Pirin domain protein n=1 Tax=Rhodomicrobium vannielii (strain ATCC 17100 / DSM 162 / LMG 4299 / NCIMB 10020 / ATH 3.1.1) TaxID=648757 RepID=E3I3A2_RHOVT|nr:pirin family protein [Rhodomicrobium vannielii]ADP71463.1 Pirin domain protein [Rhodomicrobium vannielii ATCC 17100]